MVLLVIVMMVVLLIVDGSTCKGVDGDDDVGVFKTMILIAFRQEFSIMVIWTLQE